MKELLGVERPLTFRVVLQEPENLSVQNMPAVQFSMTLFQTGSDSGATPLWLVLKLGGR